VPDLVKFDYDSSKTNFMFRTFFWEIKNRRNLVFLLVRRDLQVRYRRTVLGLLWSLINPLLSSLVLWFIFVSVFNAKLPDGTRFAPYVLSGVLLITFFSQGYLQAADSIASGIGILQKVYVKPEIFAVSSSISSAVNFFFGLFALTFVNVLVGGHFSLWIPMVLVLTISMMCLITGLGIMTAILFIKYQDSRNIVNILLLLLNYLTPIFYPKSILGKQVERIVSLNPLTSYLDIFRYVFTGTGTATTFDWLYMCGTAAGSLFLGLFIFNRYWQKTVVMM
jgi:ABC-2 type transport system permease protein